MDVVQNLTDISARPETRNVVLRVLDKLAEAQMRHAVKNFGEKPLPAPVSDVSSSQA